MHSKNQQNAPVINLCFLWFFKQALDQKPTGNSIQFKRPGHDYTEHIKEILWKLATKQLKQNDWKKLSLHWKFTDLHTKAIEHQYTGITVTSKKAR